MYYPREAQRDYLYTRNIILVIFSAVAGLVASYTFDSAILYAAIEADPNKSLAVITQIDKNPRNSRALTIEYEFTKSNESRIEGEYKMYTDYESAPFIGDKFEVIYSGFLPEYNSRSSKHPDESMSFYIFIGNILFIIFCFFLVFSTGRKIQKLKESDKFY